MYGLIKTSKSQSFHMGDLGSIGALAVALCSVSAVLYVIATAFTGGGLA
jgi:hypothetical protein